MSYLWYWNEHSNLSRFERFSWHNFHAVRTISREKPLSGFSISRIGSKNTKEQFNLDIQRARLCASTMNIYPLAIFFRSFELKIDIRSLLHNGRERRRRGVSRQVFQGFSPTSLERSPGLNPSREVRSLNTRNICFLSNETSLLNGTQHFSLSFFFSIGAFRRFRIEALVVYYYKPLHLFLPPPFFPHSSYFSSSISFAFHGPLKARILSIL